MKTYTTDQIKKAKELVQSKFAGQNKPIMAKIPSTPANN